MAHIIAGSHCVYSTILKLAIGLCKGAVRERKFMAHVAGYVSAHIGSTSNIIVRVLEAAAKSNTSEIFQFSRSHGRYWLFQRGNACLFVVDFTN